MKSLVGKFLAQLHWIILVYAAWSIYTVWEEHQTNAANITAQMPELEQEIAKSRKRLADIENYRKNIEASRKNVEEVFKNIEKVQRQLPAEVSDIGVLDFLAREGRALNILRLEPTPLPEVPQGFYVAKPYELKGEGTFLQFLIFMERLAVAERLFNIPKFTLSTPEGPQKGRFKVINFTAVVETFKYNAGHKESSGLDEIDAQFNGSASEPAPRRRRPKQSGRGDVDE